MPCKSCSDLPTICKADTSLWPCNLINSDQVEVRTHMATDVHLNASDLYAGRLASWILRSIQSLHDPAQFARRRIQLKENSDPSRLPVVLH
jgi:hypothetical protein